MENKKTNGELLVLLHKITGEIWKIEYTSENGATVCCGKNLELWRPIDSPGPGLENELNNFLFNRLCSEIESQKRNIQDKVKIINEVSIKIGIEHE